MERGGPQETPGVRELLTGLEEALPERQALLRGPTTVRAREDTEALRLLIGDYLALLEARVPPDAQAQRDLTTAWSTAVRL